MQPSELTPRTKEIMLKFFDYLEMSCRNGSRRSVHRFIREEHISPEEAKEAARIGKALILS